MKLNFLIVHYNTPRVTECLIKSINKFHSECNIYIFDNSDKAPFTYRQDNIIYLDNTKGNIINFNEWLKKYPSHQAVTYSAKHCYTIYKCFDVVNEPFILLDSDVLLKRDLFPIAEDNSLAFVGEERFSHTQRCKRVLPMLCYLNPKILKEKGVKYFDDRFMAQLKPKGGNGIFYDTGAVLSMNSNILPHKNIIMLDYIEHYGGGSYDRDVFLRIQGTNKISIDEWLNKNKKLWNDSKPNNKVIYTCITNSYDTLLEPAFKDTDDWDFICFTDNPEACKSSIWQIRALPSECSTIAPNKKQRYVKTHPHTLLSNYDISLYVDANVLLKKNPTPLLKDCIHTVSIPKHPERNCIYDEAKRVVLTKKDKAENVNPQIDRYHKEGFPAHYGLTQTNIVFRRHNEADCITLMEAWWNEIQNGSHRDQLSLHYAQWKTGGIPIDILPTSLNNCEYFLWGKFHGKKKPLPKIATLLNKKPSVREQLKCLGFLGDPKENKTTKPIIKTPIKSLDKSVETFLT